jgi:hypothetical protein
MADKQLEFIEGTGITLTGDAVNKTVTVELSSDALDGLQNTSEKGAANGYAGLDASAKVPAGNLPDATTDQKGIIEIATDTEVTTGTATDKAVTPAQVAGKEDTVNKGAASGYAGLGADGKVPDANLPAQKNLRQLDLMVPGKFAEETTSAALASIGDTSYWLLESGTVVKIAAQCSAADSGETPASVQLVLGGTPVGTAIDVLASSLTSITPVGVNITNGQQIEIAVVDTGTNGDSENLRVFIVAEV